MDSSRHVAFSPRYRKFDFAHGAGRALRCLRYDRDLGGLAEREGAPVQNVPAVQVVQTFQRALGFWVPSELLGESEGERALDPDKTFGCAWGRVAAVVITANFSHAFPSALANHPIPSGRRSSSRSPCLSPPGFAELQAHLFIVGHQIRLNDDHHVRAKGYFSGVVTSGGLGLEDRRVLIHAMDQVVVNAVTALDG